MIANGKVAVDSGRLLLPLTMLALVLAFCLATRIGPQFEKRLIESGEADENTAVYWLGSSSEMFANSMFVKADAYFHSGYYPTIYDNNAPFKTPHLAEDSGAMQSRNSGDENTIFMHPNNWVERFQLNFFPSRHTHLDEGGPSGDLAESSQLKEIMPWLKASTALDQHRIETYLVTDFWLRARMHKVNEAEAVLREGLRDNPGSAALLYELGELYRVDRKNDPQARNLYLAALESWGRENMNKPDQDKFLLGHILSSLSQLEKQEGNRDKAIQYLQLLKRVSPSPESIQRQMDELEKEQTNKTTVP
jgi:tetratricopeptide (TPR) repeat protein